MVKALESINFRIGIDSQEFFAPKFTHQLFGEKEQILGYENLAIDITLSEKFLIPLVQISYTKKAPAFAVNVTNIDKILTDHFGTIYTDVQKYQSEVLDWEAKCPMLGQTISTF